jgi:release factor glutamine methyltransferase
VTEVTSAPEPAAVSWQELLDDAVRRLTDAGFDNAEQEAWWLVQQAGGFEASEVVVHLDELATFGTATYLRQLLDRRLAGEPLQYVLERWAFRSMEIFVDDRVLIPRPETEVLTQMALEECRRLDAHVAVDLGTGSGVIAQALLVEWAGIEVWATDSSADALAVAQINLAGLGRLATDVRLVEGSWFDALPAELAGTVDVVVTNPPYVSESEVDDLPDEVRLWEPVEALVAGPTGLEDIEQIVAEAPMWLAQPGSLLVEIAPQQAGAAVRMARSAGFGSAAIWPDFAGRDRILIART